MQGIIFFPRRLRHRKPVLSCFVRPFCVILSTPSPLCTVFTHPSPLCTFIFCIQPSHHYALFHALFIPQHYENHSLRRERTLFIPQHYEYLPPKGERTLFIPQHYEYLPPKGEQILFIPQHYENHSLRRERTLFIPQHYEYLPPKGERTLFIPQHYETAIYPPILRKLLTPKLLPLSLAKCYLFPNTTKTTHSQTPPPLSGKMLFIPQHYENSSLSPLSLSGISIYSPTPQGILPLPYSLSLSLSQVKCYLFSNTTKSTPSKGSKHNLPPNTTKNTHSQTSPSPSLAECYLFPNTTKTSPPLGIAIYSSTPRNILPLSLSLSLSLRFTSMKTYPPLPQADYYLFPNTMNQFRMPMKNLSLTGTLPQHYDYFIPLLGRQLLILQHYYKYCSSYTLSFLWRTYC